MHESRCRLYVYRDETNHPEVQIWTETEALRYEFQRPLTTLLPRAAFW